MQIGGIDLPRAWWRARASISPTVAELASERYDPALPRIQADPYGFLPFGGGVRRCLGIAFALVEMKIVLAEIFGRTELRAARRQVQVVRRASRWRRPRECRS
jgi:cytochrome P450